MCVRHKVIEMSCHRVGSMQVVLNPAPSLNGDQCKTGAGSVLTGGRCPDRAVTVNLCPSNALGPCSVGRAGCGRGQHLPDTKGLAVRRSNGKRVAGENRHRSKKGID